MLSCQASSLVLVHVKSPSITCGPQQRALIRSHQPSLSYNHLRTCALRPGACFRYPATANSLLVTRADPKRRSTCKAADDKQARLGDRRASSLKVAELLGMMIQAEDAEKVAGENVNNLTEEFFMVASAMMEMAKKEGNAQVAGQLEGVLTVAWEEKQKTLRPEIQLLNKLLALQTPEELAKMMSLPKTKDVMVMNDRYFFVLLDTMISDVNRQPDNPTKGSLLAQLRDIRAQATARVPPKLII